MINRNNQKHNFRQINGWRRLLAWLCSLTLLISSSGVTAFADNVDGIYSVPVTAPGKMDTATPVPEEDSSISSPADTAPEASDHSDEDATTEQTDQTNPEQKEETEPDTADVTAQEATGETVPENTEETEGTEQTEETEDAETGAFEDMDSEPISEPVPEPIYSSGTLNAEAEGCTVQMDYPAEACIPENAVLSVSDVTGMDLYVALKSAAKQIRNEENETWNQTVADEGNRFFTVSITDEAGNEVQPSAGVTLTCWNISAPAGAVYFLTGEKARILDVQDGTLRIEQYGMEPFGYATVEKVQIGTVTQTYEGNDYQVIASYGPEAGFPADTELQVREIRPGTAEYARYSGMTEEALNEEWSEITLERYFDITFLSGSNEVEPQADIDVQIIFRDTIELTEEHDVQAVHIENNEATVIESATDSNEAALHDDEAIDTVSFSSDSFSVYGVVQRKKITQKVLAADGQTYEIEVTYGPEAEIPEDAVLRVVEIPEGSDLWEAYRRQTAAALGADDVRLPGLYDITILDAEGNEVEPKAPISVSIKLANAEEDEQLHVVHFTEEIPDKLITSEEQTEVQNLEEEDQIASEKINASVEGNTVTFETDGFSIYAFAYAVHFEYLDANCEMLGNSEVYLSKLLNDLNADVDINSVTAIYYTGSAIELQETEDGDWLVKIIPDVEEQSVLTVRTEDTVLDISTTTTGQESLDLGDAVISAADGVYLPEEATGRIEYTEENEEIIALIEESVTETTESEQNTVETESPEQTDEHSEAADPEASSPTTITQTFYQVYDISLNNVEAENYESGFQVEMKLNEAVQGDNVRLWHVHDDQVTEIKDFDLTDDTLSFVTENFSYFVISYTVDFEYANPETGETYAWSFPGRGSYAISDIMAKIGVTGIIEDISLTRTIDQGGAENALYLSEDKSELVSDEAFQDTFELTVVVAGKAYVVMVRDATSYIVEFEYESGMSFSQKTFIVLEQENVTIVASNPGGTAAHQYYIAEINTSTSEINTSTFKATYWGYQDNSYDTNKDVVIKVATANGNDVDYNGIVNNKSFGYTYYGNNDQIDGKTISIDTTSSPAKVCIGDVGTTTYTASIKFFDANSDLVSTPTLTGPYTLLAKVENDVYHATISGNANTINFLNDSGNPVANDFNLTNAAQFKIVTGSNYDWSTATSVTAMDAYVNVVLPTSATGGVYAITASEPRNCTASISFKDTSNSTQHTPELDPSYQYYVVAVKNGSPVGYAKFSSSSYSTLTFTGEAPDDAATTTLWVVRSATELANVSQISDLTDIADDSGDLLGDYEFIWSNTPTGTTYAVTGKEHNINSVRIVFFEADGTTALSSSTPAFGTSYYVIGRDEHTNPVCYAQVSNNGTIGAFKSTSDQAVNVLENLGSVLLTRYTGSVAASSMTYSELSGHKSDTYDGGPVADETYTVVQCTPTPDNKVITLQLKLRPRNYNLAMTYDPGNPVLDSEHYYLLIKERGSYKYYVQLANYGNLGTKKNADGTDAGDLKTAYGFTFELVKADSTPSNIDNLTSLTRISNVGATVYNSSTSSNESVNYTVTFPTSATSQTYTITATVSTSCTASISFYDAWSETPNASPTLTSHTLVANDGTTDYTATFSAPGTLNFSDALPGTALTWTLDGTALTDLSTVDLDGYILTCLPTKTGTNYAFVARKPNTYTASLTFKNASNMAERPSSLSSGYYLVVNDAIYAPVTASGIGTWVGVTENKLPQITSFEFVQNTGTVSSVSDLTSRTALTKLDDYDIITTTVPTPDGSHNYAFEAKLPTVCTAKLTLTGEAPTSTDYYYIVARRNNANIGYARFTATVDPLTFTDGTNNVTLDDHVTFRIVKAQSEATALTDFDNPAEKLTASGELGDYTFTLPGSSVNDVYEIAAEKLTLYGLTMTFDPSTGVTLGSDSWYLLVKCGGTYKYYAQLTDTGFANIRKADGTDVTGITAASAFEIVKTSDASPAFATLQSFAKITDSGTIGEYYTVGIPSTPTEGNYVFTATKQANTVTVQFKDAEDTNATPTLDGYHYLVAKNNGERKYFAPVTGNGTLSFTDASDNETATIPNATFELVYSATEITSLASLPAATASTFVAGSAEYALGEAMLTDSTYAFTPTELSGIRILFQFLDKDGNPVISPSVPTGYYMMFRDASNNYFYAVINDNGTVGTFVDGSDATVTTLPQPQEFRIARQKNWNCNEDQKIKTGETFGEYQITYPSTDSVPLNGKYIFTAQKPDAFIIEICMLNADGELQQPAAQLSGNNYKLVAVMVRDSDKVAKVEENNMNPGNYASKFIIVKTFGSDVSYTDGARVETYFGPDMGWNSENQTVNNAGNNIKNGSVVGDYWFEVVKETGKVTYIGHPLTPHTVNVQFDVAPSSSYQVYAEEIKNGKTYKATSNNLTFNDSHLATTSFTSLTAESNGGTIAVSANTKFYIMENYSTKYGNGGVDGSGKAYTIITSGDTTTITRGTPAAYPYTIKVMQSDGITGTSANPDLNNEEWYVQASVTRPDGTYSNVVRLLPTDFTGDTLTASIPYFYRESDANNSGNAAKTAYLHGEHVSFALLRPAGQVTTPAWAYYANTSNINYNGLNNSAIEGLYTLNIVETTTAGSENTLLKLVTGSGTSLTFAAHSGSTKDTTIEIPADLNDPGTGKYFVFARLNIPDGVKRRTGFYVAELPTTLPTPERTTYAISNGFSVNRAESGEGVAVKKYLAVGDRIFDTGLVYTTDRTMTVEDMLAQLNQYEVSTQIRVENHSAGSSRPYTLITHSQAAGGYRLISGEGSRENPVGTLDLVKLPRLSVAGEVRLANGAMATVSRDSTNHYYSLIELVHDRVKSYAFQPLNTADNASGITTASATLNEFVDTSTGRKYFYETGDTVNYYIVKSAEEITSLSIAVAAQRFAEGQLMGVYTPSFEQDGNNVIAVLNEQAPQVDQAHTVNIRLYDYNKTTELTSGSLPTEVYSVLTWLTPKGTGAKGQVVAWRVDRAKVTDNDTGISGDQLNATGHTSFVIPESGFAICDAKMDAIADAYMGYDPDLYDLNVRVFHGSTVMTCYNDRYAESDPSTHTLVYSDNAPTGYDYMDPVQTSETTTIRLNNAYKKDYQVQLKINQIDEMGISFNSSDNYWLMVQLNHKSGSPTYAFAKLEGIDSNSEGETTHDLTLYTVKDAGDASREYVWFEAGHGNPTLLMSEFTGNEKSVSFQIIEAEMSGDKPSFGNIINGTGNSVHINIGESIDLYTLSVGERTKTETIDGVNSTTHIVDTIVLTEDVNGIKKGEIDAIVAQAREFGLYTEILSKHATDMEANIGADRVTGPMGEDYGFSSRNTMVNRLKVVKQYLDTSNQPANNKQVTLGLFDALTGEQVGDSIQKTTGNDGMPNGVAEFEFSGLPAGKYIIKELINGAWYGYEDVDDPIAYDGGQLTVNFADGVITMRDINSNVNYFGTISDGVNLTDLLRHSRQGTVVTDNNYSDLLAADPDQNLATIYQTGTVEYPKTYDIPADMANLRSLSARLADSTSSKTVRVMNYKLGDIPSNGIAIKGDGRYVVLNIDVTGCGSMVNVFTRIHYDGRQLDPDFGGNGREDSSKVLWNFITRDSEGNAHAYTGHIDTECEGAGILLAPSAVVGDLGGNWGGTIICHEAQHAVSEIHSDNPNKIINTNSMLTNSLSTTKLGNLTLYKAITGDTHDRTTWFTFSVTLKDADGNPLTGSYVASGLKSGNTVTFDTSGQANIQVRAENTVTITGLPNGATYHVDELETEESEFYQLVQIENGDGYVTPDGTIKGGKTVVVKAINAHKVGGLTVSKTVAGITTTQEFQFRVTIMAENSETEPASDINGVYGGMNFMNGVATFTLGNGESRTIEASEIPTGRKFKVEELDADALLNGKQFVTDVVVKTTGGVTCLVEENVVTGTISDDKNAIIVAYTNTHTNGTTYRPKVTKNLVKDNDAVADAKWPADGFTFTLAADSTNPAGATLTSTSATATAASKTATFGAIQFDYNSEPWERIYHFTITEEQGSAPGMTYNTTPLNMWVHVVRNTIDPDNPVLVVDDVQYGGGNYDESRADKPADSAAITISTGAIANDYDEVTGHPDGTKVLTGRDWGESETFQFTLTPDIFTLNRIGKTVDLPVPGVHDTFTVNDETQAITITVSKPLTDNTQSFTFPDLAFKAEGTYSFIMEEVGKGSTVNGLAYSGKSVKATFTVTKNASTNKLEVSGPVYTILGGAQGDVENATANTFVNDYTSTDAYYTPTVTKSLVQNSAAVGNAMWPEEGFKFLLEVDASNPAGATVPTNRRTTATYEAKTASFEEIKFTKTTGVDYPATYRFVISEIEPDGTVNHVKDGITYSTDRLYLNVVVEDSGKLVIQSATYRLNDASSGAESDTITNTIPHDGQTNLKIVKVDSTDQHALSGAVFSLEKQNDDRTTWSTIASYASITVTSTDGFTLTDLTDGTYRLTETQAPTGYNKLSDPIMFTISNGTVESPTGPSSITIGYAAAATTTNAETGAVTTTPATFTIPNIPGVVLPATGGSGTLIYTVGGLAMVLLAGTLLISRRKKKRT